MMCKLKGRIDKGEQYNVEIKVDGHTEHYHFQIKRADGQGRAL